MESLTDLTEEEVLWDRALAVTGRPKPNLLARQILDPSYYRSMLDFCIRVAGAQGFFVAPGEVEGALRVWADSAKFTPLGAVEHRLWPLLNKLAKDFSGWESNGTVSFSIHPSCDGNDAESDSD